MDARMHKCTNGRINGWIYESTNVWMHEFNQWISIMDLKTSCVIDN